MAMGENAMKAIAKLHQRMQSVQSCVCVGLDSDIQKIPSQFKNSENPQFAFNTWIIEQTHAVAAAYKLNFAFYEARGAAGWQDLSLTMEYLTKHHPDIFTIADAKRADIGSTNEGYVQAIFDQLQFDAVTLHPYLGQEALSPFLDRKDKVCILLCKTSNPGGGELQNLMVGGKPLWHIIAEKVNNEWDRNENCMLVVGATYPKELAQIRKIVGDMTILVPGIGAQGGDVQSTMLAGSTKNGNGLLINASRSIIFAENPGEEAKVLAEEINKNCQYSET
jgi:orotidine-5'-phosphate decarboxylase